MPTSILNKAKTVFVRAYVRFRFQRLESVRQHWRSPPEQLSLDF